jgi:hypothetical protein
MPIKKEEGVQSLVLRGRTHIPHCGEIIEEGGNLLLAHCRRMPTLVKQHESPNPIAIGLFSALAVMTRLQLAANTLEQPQPSFRLWAPPQM